MSIALQPEPGEAVIGSGEGHMDFGWLADGSTDR